MKSFFKFLTLLPTVVRAVSLWETTGPYNVGVTQHVFNHTTPDDVTEPGGILLVTIHYPTLQTPNTTGSYLDPESLVIYGQMFGFPNETLSNLTTNLQPNAPTLLGTSPEFGNGTSPHPTVIFLPGLDFPVGAYTAYQSELASHGYCVIGIDHPGEAAFIQLPNGGPGIPGPQAAIGDSGADTDASRDFGVAKYRISDVLAVVSDPYFPSLVRNTGAPFNTTHYAVFGHSIGGSGALGVLASNDTSAGLFKVGGDIDGTLLQYFNQTSQTVDTSVFVPDVKRPVLEIASEPHFNGSAANPYDGTWAYFNQAQKRAWWKQVQFNGTKHMDFSDLPLLAERLGQRESPAMQSTIGTTDAVRTTLNVTSLIRQLVATIEGHPLSEIEDTIEGIPDIFLLDGSNTSVCT